MNSMKNIHNLHLTAGQGNPRRFFFHSATTLDIVLRWDVNLSIDAGPDLPQSPNQ